MKKCALLLLLFVAVGLRAGWEEGTFLIWPLRGEAERQAAVVSWSDWLVFGNATYGKPGVRYVLNQMASSGIRGVWWRMFGGGHAQYPTAVDGATVANYSGQGGDFSAFDSLAEAEHFCRRLGLGFYVWFTPYEEAHGWSNNVRSRYVDRHREAWDRLANGAPAGAPGFAMPAYRDYKAAFVEEVFRRYRPDGIVIDLERVGAPGRTNRWGYRPEEIERFHRETGRTGRPEPDDPAWQRFRARSFTLFMEQVRAIAARYRADAAVEVMYPARTPLSAHWDIAELAKRRLADRLIPVAHGAVWGSPGAVPAGTARYDLPVSAIVYMHRNGRSAPAVIAENRQNGIDRWIWFETTYFNFNGEYDIPRRINAVGEATLAGPAADFAGGGEVTVLAAGAWQLELAGKPLAAGPAGRCATVVIPPESAGKLVIRCTLPDEAQSCGVAVQGHAVDRAGRKTAIRSDESWTSEDGTKVYRTGVPGIPPFLSGGEER